MIQVINRAFDILELVSQDPSRSYGLSDIADRLQLNHATCANIIKTMVSRKYLEQVAPKKGYRLGFMAYQIAGDSPYEDKLKNAAAGIMEHLTGKLNETCLLAILKKEKRLIIHQIHADRDLMVKSSIEKDAYSSASGRFLVAALSGKEQEAFVEKYGLPSKDVWPEASTASGLQREFDAIRTRGYAQQVTLSQIIGLACGIYENGRIIASLSVYLPASRMTDGKESEIIEQLKKTALLLEEKLTQ